jgi:hypothetical protein
MVFLNRRKLLGISLASGSMLMSSMKAQASFSGDVQLRGQIERLERLPTLGLEGRESFRTSFRKFINTDLNRAARRRAETILKQAGIDPGDDVSMQEVVGLLEGDPVLMSHAHAFLNVQQAMWTDLQNAFHSDADRYLEEMAISS